MQTRHGSEHNSNSMGRGDSLPNLPPKVTRSPPRIRSTTRRSETTTHGRTHPTPECTTCVDSPTCVGYPEYRGLRVMVQDTSPDTNPHICSPFTTLTVSCPPPFKFNQDPFIPPPPLLTLIRKTTYHLGENIPDFRLDL